MDVESGRILAPTENCKHQRAITVPDFALPLFVSDPEDVEYVNYFVATDEESYRALGRCYQPPPISFQIPVKPSAVGVRGAHSARVGEARVYGPRGLLENNFDRSAEMTLSQATGKVVPRVAANISSTTFVRPDMRQNSEILAEVINAGGYRTDTEVSADAITSAFISGLYPMASGGMSVGRDSTVAIAPSERNSTLLSELVRNKQVADLMRHFYQLRDARSERGPATAPQEHKGSVEQTEPRSQPLSAAREGSPVYMNDEPVLQPIQAERKSSVAPASTAPSQPPPPTVAVPPKQLPSIQDTSRPAPDSHAPVSPGHIRPIPSVSHMLPQDKPETASVVVLAKPQPAQVVADNQYDDDFEDLSLSASRSEAERPAVSLANVSSAKPRGSPAKDRIGESQAAPKDANDGNSLTITGISDIEPSPDQKPLASSSPRVALPPAAEPQPGEKQLAKVDAKAGDEQQNDTSGTDFYISGLSSLMEDDATPQSAVNTVAAGGATEPVISIRTDKESHPETKKDAFNNADYIKKVLAGDTSSINLDNLSDSDDVSDQVQKIMQSRPESGSNRPPSAVNIGLASAKQKASAKPAPPLAEEPADDLINLDKLVEPAVLKKAHAPAKPPTKFIQKAADSSSDDGEFGFL